LNESSKRTVWLTCWVNQASINYIVFNGKKTEIKGVTWVYVSDDEHIS